MSFWSDLVKWPDLLFTFVTLAASFLQYLSTTNDRHYMIKTSVSCKIKWKNVEEWQDFTSLFILHNSVRNSELVQSRSYSCTLWGFECCRLFSHITFSAWRQHSVWARHLSCSQLWRTLVQRGSAPLQMYLLGEFRLSCQVRWGGWCSRIKERRGVFEDGRNKAEFPLHYSRHFIRRV